MQSRINRKRACIPGVMYTSAPSYLPDPLFDFSEGLVSRLLVNIVVWTRRIRKMALWLPHTFVFNFLSRCFC